MLLVVWVLLVFTCEVVEFGRHLPIRTRGGPEICVTAEHSSGAILVATQPLISSA